MLIDKTVSKSNKGYGFANTKAIVGFEKAELRDNVVKERSNFDFSCKKVFADLADKKMIGDWKDLVKNIGLEQAQAYFLGNEWFLNKN